MVTNMCLSGVPIVCLSWVYHVSIVCLSQGVKPIPKPTPIYHVCQRVLSGCAVSLGVWANLGVPTIVCVYGALVWVVPASLGCWFGCVWGISLVSMPLV